MEAVDEHGDLVGRWMVEATEASVGGGWRVDVEEEGE